ncbi:N-formylglutamate amidohydrolase [Flavobacterium selenitireducens]|uniref:N-formylglutamate amidohydrolase n=1 Tax=Flavobacterium selenitireducens TaxID=2722704 RepID=UPI00168C0054|nr:N-formylglutamate amidohydrolase [Flavobacterium selenitireducens]MBD3582858.1 N-formylglutamate deformylase [Flavobacterium selenitireducens]
MELYTITQPTADEVPILISSPHSGTYFPPGIKSRIKPELAERPDDADWFIDKLYDFAPAMGIGMIEANYCRWVIDLNRYPQREPLYYDGRVITGLCPVTDFNGLALYHGKKPDDAEIEQRLEEYFIPYHKKVEEMLAGLVERHGVALLFDAHSIRKSVPGISKTPFPDLILGDNDLTSASPAIIAAAYEALKKGPFEVNHNIPFKGGYITRFFGQRQDNIHALQLEMAKKNYMDDSETEYHEGRAEGMRALLKDMFTNIIDVLKK